MLDTSITFCQHQLVRNQLHLKWASSHTHQFMITRERIQKMPSNLGHVKGRRQASSPYYTKAFSMATSTSTKTKALWDNPLQLFFLKAHPFHLCQNEFLLWLYKIFSYYWNNYFLFDLLYIRFSNYFPRSPTTRFANKLQRRLILLPEKLVSNISLARTSKKLNIRLWLYS